MNLAKPMYDNFGTPAGRRLGGQNSYKNSLNKAQSIFTRKSVSSLEQTEQLAEFIGILIGDGCVTKYQVSISTNAVDDSEYVLFIDNLIQRLFKTTPTIVRKGITNCVTITVSSIALVALLKSHGIVEGHKIRQGLDIPDWIKRDVGYAKACIRGIFDTDGCIYQERHHIKSVVYSYPRMSFVSMSPALRTSIRNLLLELEFDPRIRNNRSVNLERAEDINRYFLLVGTSNPKHFRRFKMFGGVA